jgi:hypothetical protein
VQRENLPLQLAMTTSLSSTLISFAGEGPADEARRTTFHPFFVDHLGGGIGEFAPLPRFHLLPHRFEVALHPIHAGYNVSKFHPAEPSAR